MLAFLALDLTDWLLHLLPYFAHYLGFCASYVCVFSSLDADSWNETVLESGICRIYINYLSAWQVLKHPWFWAKVSDANYTCSFSLHPSTSATVTILYLRSIFQLSYSTEFRYLWTWEVDETSGLQLNAPRSTYMRLAFNWWDRKSVV